MINKESEWKSEARWKLRKQRRLSYFGFGLVGVWSGLLIYTLLFAFSWLRILWGVAGLLFVLYWLRQGLKGASMLKRMLKNG